MKTVTIKRALLLPLMGLAFILPISAGAQQVVTNELSSGACMIVCNDVNFCRTYDYNDQTGTCTIFMHPDHREFVQLKKSCPQIPVSNWIISLDDGSGKWRIACPPRAVNRSPLHPSYALVPPRSVSQATKRLPAALTSLMISSNRFQAMAITNFPKALKFFSSGKGGMKLHGINATIWTEKSFQYGWMTFFNSAVRVSGPNPNRLPVIGYYNPYSDTMLVTVWKRVGGTYRIVDADMIMGDLLRLSKKTPTTKPILMRLMEDGGNWHGAVGYGVARTMLAFEKALANASTRNWRKKLKVFSNGAALHDLNYAGVSVLVNTHLKGIGLYVEPHNSDQSMVERKRIVSRTIGLFANGDVEQAFNSTQTPIPDNIKNALKQLPSQWFRTLHVAFAAGSSSDTIIYLTPYTATNLSFSLTIKKGNRGYYLDRIDIIDFQSFYVAVKEHRQKKSGGRR